MIPAFTLLLACQLARELAGTFAGLGLAWNGIATAVLVPLLTRGLR